MDELRWTCALCWTLLGVLLWRRSRGGPRLVAVVLCALAVAADLARWHVDLWHAARELLHGWGLYSARAAVKAGVAAVLLLAAFGLVRLAAPLRASRSGRATLAVGAWLVYLLAWTAFLDDLLPAAMGRPAARYGLEAAWALLPALWLVARRGR